MHHEAATCAFISILCHCKVLEVNFVLLCVILLAVLAELMLDVTISASMIVISCFIMYVILCLKLIIVIFIRQYFLMSLCTECSVWCRPTTVNNYCLMFYRHLMSDA